MENPKIKYVEALNNYRLFVIFETGEIKIYSVRELLKNPDFSALKDETLFLKAKKAEGGYGVVWNDEIDLSEYEIWKNGVAVSSINKLTDSIVF